MANAVRGGRPMPGPGLCVRSWLPVAVATAVAVLLSACGADPIKATVDAPGIATAARPADPTGSIDVSAPPSQEGARKFDPFNPTAETSSPLRQVIANPTVAEIMQPGPLPEISVGRADAPVVIVKYMSLTCPFCRQFQASVYPELKRTYLDTGKVRLILREFPIGFQSGMATIALRCVPKERYVELYGRFLSQQARWVSQEVRRDPIVEVAKSVGLTRSAFDACIENRALIDGLKAIKDRGRTLGIIGTPNFFVDGRLVKKVLTMAEIRELVEPALAARVANAAPRR